MIPASTLLIGDAERALRRELTAGVQPLDAAFAVWLLGKDAAPLTIDGPLTDALTRTGGARSYEHVAVLGYSGEDVSLDQGGRTLLEQGLGWLSSREPIVDGQPMGFCLDPVAVLGTALGARSVGGVTKDRVTAWARRFVGESATRERLGAWQRALFSIAGGVLGLAGVAVDLGSEVADVRVAMRAKGLLPVLGADREGEDEASVLDTLRTVKPEGAARAALRLAALAWVRRKRPVVPLNAWTAEGVANLLRRFDSAMRLWTYEKEARVKDGTARKWFVDHEYHVQNILWAMLSPIFPDLVNEENLPSLGPKKPRADLGIPSLKLIVEVKFLRKGISPQKMIDQIGSDASLYLADRSRFDKIIAFVWDNSRKTEQHDFLALGLKKIGGVVDAIVVSRPSMLP